MNRKQKIIISITGITIILLALVGLTYAYFLTQITGNENPTSISVTTANLEVVYSDNSQEILSKDQYLTPSLGTSANEAIGTKTFKVLNEGNDSSYIVIIDNVRITKGEDITTFKTNDFRYTLTCTKKDGTKCNEVETISIFPIKGGILVGNNILENDEHSYTLTMWYIDNGDNQSDDMGKTLQARVNITDIKRMENPYKTGNEEVDNKNLAYNIIENAESKKNGTELLNASATPVAKDIARYRGNIIANEEHWFDGWDYIEYGTTEHEAILDSKKIQGNSNIEKCESVKDQYIINTQFSDVIPFKVIDCEADGTPIIYGYIDDYESSLSMTQDDYGTSYFYRGNVEDNYVNFAEMCWRIVRIQGDGSIKLILEDIDTTCDNDLFAGEWGIGTGNYGYEYQEQQDHLIMNYLKPKTNANSSMVKAFYDFETTGKLKNYTDKLKSGDWCIGDKAYSRSGIFPNYTYTPLEEYVYSSEWMIYDSDRRLGTFYRNVTPTLICTGALLDNYADVTVNGTTITNNSPMYVGTLTADEVVYAGAMAYFNANSKFYLINSNFDKNSKYSFFWLLSPAIFDGDHDSAFNLSSNGYLSDMCGYVDGSCDNFAFRPSIVLKSSTTIVEGGQGTLESPYVIE